MEEDTKYKSFLSRIVFKFRDSFYLAYHINNEINDFFHSNNIVGWKHLQTQFPGIAINNLFTSIPAQRIVEIVERAKKLNPNYFPPNFLNYYAIDCPDKTNVYRLLELLCKKEDIELAYIESESTVPQSLSVESGSNILYPDYLKPAPVGIDVDYAWNIKGGDGNGTVKFIDIEQGWILDHQNIPIKTFSNTGIIQNEFQDHGTAVLSVIIQNGDVREMGITPRATGYVVSQWRPNGTPNTADAIMTAIDHLGFGDIILLEAQVFDSLRRFKLWPVEIQDAIFHVIRLATMAGIIVIEAAGNGNIRCSRGNDLDVFADQKGKYILNRSNSDCKDSGAIIVAAASNIEHERLRYSNYGNRIDCYAPGEQITTSHSAKNRYMRNFSGTSSAAAIITGVAIAVQSIYEAKHESKFSAIQMRSILGNDLYGTASANGRANDKIGVMPDLKKIIDKRLMCSKSLKYFSDSAANG